MFGNHFRVGLIWTFCVIAAVQLALPTPAPIPSIQGHLTAPGNQLTADQKRELDLRLGKIQEQAKFDMAIYILPEKSSAPLRTWGTDIYRTWGIGRDWPNGGILLVVSHDGAQSAVIQSVPGSIPDKLLPLMEQTVVKRSQEKRLYAGLVEVAERCRRFVGGKSLPVLQEQLEPDTAAFRSYLAGCATLLIAAFVSSWSGWAR